MRRLLKLAVKLLLITLAVVSLCGMTAEGYADEIADAVPPEASEILDGAGITPDNNGAASLEPQGVLSWLWEQCRDRLTEPVRLLAALCGIVLLCTLAKSFGDGSASMSGVFSAVGVLAGAGMTAAAVSDALTHTVFPGVVIGFVAGRTTSWSEFHSTPARFSAIVRPVTVRQSPCMYPASSRVFMSSGMPPASNRSLATYRPPGLRSAI